MVHKFENMNSDEFKADMEKMRSLKERLRTITSINGDEFNKFYVDNNITSFITGSVAFGLETLESDLDICISKRVGKMITEFVGENNVIRSQYHDGFYVKVVYGDERRDQLLNFIPLEAFEYQSWKWMTSLIADMAKDEDVRELLRAKKYRVKLFEKLLNMADDIKRDMLNKEIKPLFS